MPARPEEVRAAVAWLPPSLPRPLRNDALITRAVPPPLARRCADGTWSSETRGELGSGQHQHGNHAAPTPDRRMSAVRRRPVSAPIRLAFVPAGHQTVVCAG